MSDSKAELAACMNATAIALDSALAELHDAYDRELRGSVFVSATLRKSLLKTNAAAEVLALAIRAAVANEENASEG